MYIYVHSFYQLHNYCKWFIVILSCCVEQLKKIQAERVLRKAQEEEERKQKEEEERKKKEEMEKMKMETEDKGIENIVDSGDKVSCEVAMVCISTG